MKEKSTSRPGSTLAIHEAAELFPIMGDVEFAALKADIQEHGQREPIAVLGGKIIDGRNRYRACLELSIEPKTAPCSPSTDAVVYVLSANLHRRHLTESQRAIFGGRLKEHYALGAKERQLAGQRSGGRGRKKNSEAILPPSNSSGDVREQVAKAVGVSARTIDYAATVLAKGSNDLVAAVEAGKVRVSRAAKVATSHPEAEQLAAATARTSRKQRPSDTTQDESNASPSVICEKSEKGILDLNDAFLRLDEVMREVYLRWPAESRTSLASKLRDWSEQLYGSNSIAALECRS